MRRPARSLAPRGAVVPRVMELRELDYAVHRARPAIEGYLATANGKAELHLGARPRHTEHGQLLC